MNNFLNSWKDRSNRIVIFAGVFDPVHKGHISAAEMASFHGSEVIFLPERVPQHKHNATDYKHRINMLEIALKNKNNMSVIVCPDEQHLIEPTFTWLNQLFPGRKFVWLVGNDVVPKIESWKGSEKLKALNVAKIIVIKRKGLNDNYINKVHDTPVEHINRPRKRHENISSTYISEDLEHRHTSLPDGVYEYIKANNLYN